MNYLSEAIEMKVKAILLICYQYSEVRAYLRKCMFIKRSKGISGTCQE